MAKKVMVAFIKGGKEAKFPKPLLPYDKPAEKTACIAIEKKDDRRISNFVKRINLDVIENSNLDRFEQERGNRSPFAYYLEPKNVARK